MRDMRWVRLTKSCRKCCSLLGMLSLWICALTMWAGHCAARGEDPLSDDKDGADWPGYGRTYSELHFSPLTKVNVDNISSLGLAWDIELPNTHSGATVPLAVGGIIYFCVDQSVVRAVDAQSGKVLWTYDPKVAEVAGARLQHAWGVRGLGFWKGKVYVGTMDGRLIAIDATTGKEVWSQMTLENSGGFISGAPRIFHDLVVIGNGGAELEGVRGYVTAYDAKTGKLRWRFYTVPASPNPNADPVMLQAAATWTGHEWQSGAGGTVWNAITYDSEQHLIYIGTSNGAPWNQGIRSPGGGDNLFCNSIVALDADTGKYRWHYQTTPGDTWDYDSTNDIELATLTIDGASRKVIIHAPKNGFFYVIDRTNGKLLSAQPFTKVTWAERIDLATGRPVEAPGARYYQSKPQIFFPSMGGGTNWTPMAFSPITGLAYFQETELPGFLDGTGLNEGNWRRPSDQISLGLNLGAEDAPTNLGQGHLLAWDPVEQRARWKVQTPGIWNGGVLATAGGLVFQGRGTGTFVAYDAVNGSPKWFFDAHMGISGAPISFLVKGEQYVAVVAGWGGSGAATYGSLGAQMGWVSRVHSHRLLAFKLGAHQTLPVGLPARMIVSPLDDPGLQIDNTRAAEGEDLYAHSCIMCHGAGAVASGFAPDLRASAVVLDANSFAQVVAGGALTHRGMPRFSALSKDDLTNLSQFIRKQARNPKVGPTQILYDEFQQPTSAARNR